MARPIQEKTQSKWARLRQVATEEPKEADSAIAEVAEALGTMADALSNLRENLDLIEAPKTANIKVRIATARKYATAFRRIAEDTPEIVAGAISEVYHSLDDVAGAFENLAENLGVELSLTPAEEAIGEEGKAELEGEWGAEEPESGESGAAPAEEKLDAELEKEAGSQEWTSDRDEEGQPKSPVIAAATCSQCSAGHEDPKKPGFCKRHGKRIKKEKKADGSAAFISDRDNAAKPEAPAKLDIPEAQGETEVGKAAAKRAAVRDRIAKRWGVQL
jgi:hypothetical protein